MTVASIFASSSKPNRRSVLRWVALGGGIGMITGCGGVNSERDPQRDPPMTVKRWRSVRGERYLIAHRGSGDVVPEHTLEAYTAALGWGAQALEVSVCQTRDGVLVCNHDLTLDRTTNLTGRVSDRTIAEVDAGRVEVPRLGPRWQGDGRPRIAHLDEALDVIGTQAVVCLEAKDDSAYPALMELVRHRGLTRQVYVKAHASSSRIEEAHVEGYPVFGYLGSAREVTPSAINMLAGRLRSPEDVMVLPGYADGGLPLADDLVSHALSTGVEVWLFPLHRRADVEHFAALGVNGTVTPSFGYLAATSAPDSALWPGNALRPGTMTRFPESARFGLKWPADGVVSLDLQGEQHFVTIGGPVVQGSHPVTLSLDLDLRLDRASDESADAPLAAVSLGHDDDRYFDLTAPAAPSHQVVVAADGTISVLGRSHRGTDVAATVAGPTLQVGIWEPIRIIVEGSRLSVSRKNGSTVSVDGVTLGAGYIHLGRVSRSGAVSLRGVALGLS